MLNNTIFSTATSCDGVTLLLLHSLSGEKKVELQSDLQNYLQSGLQSGSCQDDTEECKTDELREFCNDPNVKELCPLSCGQCGMQLNNRFIFFINLSVN